MSMDCYLPNVPAGMAIRFMERKPNPKIVGREIMSAFTDMMARLKAKEGYSPETARKVAAKIGDESIGKEEMAKRSAESRKEHESESK